MYEKSYKKLLILYEKSYKVGVIRELPCMKNHISVYEKETVALYEKSYSIYKVYHVVHIFSLFTRLPKTEYMEYNRGRTGEKCNDNGKRVFAAGQNKRHDTGKSEKREKQHKRNDVFYWRRWYGWGTSADKPK